MTSVVWVKFGFVVLLNCSHNTWKCITFNCIQHVCKIRNIFKKTQYSPSWSDLSFYWRHLSLSVILIETHNRMFAELLNSVEMVQTTVAEYFFRAICALSRPLKFHEELWRKSKEWIEMGDTYLNYGGPGAFYALVTSISWSFTVSLCKEKRRIMGKNSEELWESWRKSEGWIEMNTYLSGAY